MTSDDAQDPFLHDPQEFERMISELEDEEYWPLSAVQEVTAVLLLTKREGVKNETPSFEDRAGRPYSEWAIRRFGEAKYKATLAEVAATPSEAWFDKWGPLISDDDPL